MYTKDKTEVSRTAIWTMVIFGHGEEGLTRLQGQVVPFYNILYFYNKHEFYQKIVISVLSGRCSVGLLDEKHPAKACIWLQPSLLIAYMG